MSDPLKLPTDEFEELLAKQMSGVTGDLARKAAADVEAAIQRNLSLMVGEQDFPLAAIIICQACSMKAIHILASATSVNNQIARTGGPAIEGAVISMACWMDALLGSARFLSVEQRVDIIRFAASKGWITNEDAEEILA